MSSSRVLDPCAAVRDDEIEQSEWTVIEPPSLKRPMPQASGVILALANLRSVYAQDRLVDELEPDEQQGHGSGDSELADDIERTVDAYWAD